VNIVTSFLSRARSHGHLPAITDANATVTFAQLERAASALAAGLLKQHGLQAGDRVVLYMENRREFFETLLACWIAGLAAVPINSKLHPREVKVIVTDCSARVVVTTTDAQAGLDEVLSSVSDAPVIVTVRDQDYERLLQHAPMPPAANQPTDLAWLFYTSGTTGAPKGAILTHRNYMNMTLRYYADINFIEPAETMLHAAPLSHGSGLYGVAHLLAGGHQVIEKGFSTDAVLQGLQQYEGVTIFGAPTMITRLVQAAKGVTNPRGNLKTCFYGGAPMYLSDLLETIEVFGYDLCGVYGQGESPMTITALSRYDHRGDGGAEHIARLSSCGTARTGVDVRVVDEQGRVLSIGEPGEVITRSDTVMTGYWGNEKATANALRDGWLWTGDVGAFDDKGYLTLKDRSKDLIIRGGSNIYPREIEEVLLMHPAVAEVSVIGRQHADLGEEPVAFVVTRDGQSVSPDELDQLCLNNIARFKRPREFFFESALPKNNYGKILKTELRKKFV